LSKRFEAIGAVKNCKARAESAARRALGKRFTNQIGGPWSGQNLEGRGVRDEWVEGKDGRERTSFRLDV
jgi:hypothetical protein